MWSMRVSWTARRRKRWEALRARGRRHYVLVYGVGLFGGCVWLSQVGTQLLLRQFRTYNGMPIENLLALAIISFSIFLVAGYLYGNWMWAFTERAYQEHLRTQTDVRVTVLSPDVQPLVWGVVGRSQAQG